VAAATATVRPRPADALALEVDLAGWLAARGAPIVPPSGLVPPGPHAACGRVLSLWQHVPASGVADGRPEVVATLLAAVHDLAVGYTGRLPGPEEILADVVRAAEVTAGHGGLGAGQRRRMEQGAALAAGLAVTDGMTLHGDPHPGNVLLVGPAALLTDFEDSWRGPMEWDLTVLRMSRRHDGAAALAAYTALTGARPDTTLMEACARVREVQALAWRVLMDAYRSGVLA
jgi:Ser/Thr protein kinase RdoA (MazF antagonist)